MSKKFLLKDELLTLPKYIKLLQK